MTDEGFLARWSRRKRQARAPSPQPADAAAASAPGASTTAPDSCSPGARQVTDEGFLARWSRRKRQARARSPQPANAAAASVQGASTTAPDTAAPEISPEELARLPRLEELTAESDLAQFLREGVPLPLRNAALRRAWALDPKIRDRVGDALDYAYDWNAADGVPGAGPLAENEIEEQLRRVLGGDEPSTAVRESRPDTPSEGGPIAAAAAPDEPSRETRTAEAGTATPDMAPGAAPARRRHGRALPS